MYCNFLGYLQENLRWVVKIAMVGIDEGEQHLALLTLRVAKNTVTADLRVYFSGCIPCSFAISQGSFGILGV